MKMQILHAPTVILYTCIPASFKLGLQTLFCITAATSQDLLCDTFSAIGPTVDLDVNRLIVRHDLIDHAQILSPLWSSIDQ